MLVTWHADQELILLPPTYDLWIQNTRNLNLWNRPINNDTKKHDVRVNGRDSCQSDYHLLKTKIVFYGKENVKEVQARRIQHCFTKNTWMKSLTSCLDQRTSIMNLLQTVYIGQQKKHKYYEEMEWNKPQWWNKDIEKEIQTRRNIYEEILANKINTTTGKYNEAQNEERKMITKEKNAIILINI